MVNVLLTRPVEQKTAPVPPESFQELTLFVGRLEQAKMLTERESSRLRNLISIGLAGTANGLSGHYYKVVSQIITKILMKKVLDRVDTSAVSESDLIRSLFHLAM